jgi:putative membrane protein
MSYLKAIFISAVVALAIIFMVQNIQPLSHPLSIRLNLFFVKFETTPYATYMVILLAFFVGLLVASLLGLAERFRLRKRLRDLRKRNDKLRDELNSLRNMPLNDPVSGPPELEEEEEGGEASQT